MHRVPGAPPGPAAQQQCGASRRGGSARLRPRSHQAARFLLQVHAFIENVPVFFLFFFHTLCNLLLPTFIFAFWFIYIFANALLLSLQPQCEHSFPLRPAGPHRHGTKYVSQQCRSGRHESGGIERPITSQTVACFCCFLFFFTIFCFSVKDTESTSGSGPESFYTPEPSPSSRSSSSSGELLSKVILFVLNFSLPSWGLTLFFGLLEKVGRGETPVFEFVDPEIQVRILFSTRHKNCN